MLSYINFQWLIHVKDVDKFTIQIYLIGLGPIVPTLL